MKIEAELLERVKAATGQDTEIDRQLFVALLGGNFWPENSAFFTRDYYGSASPAQFTASIDAALALVERVLPGGVDIVLKLQTGGKYFHAEFEADDGDYTAFNHPSLPLAILAALLSALDAQP